MNQRPLVATIAALIAIGLPARAEDIKHEPTVSGGKKTSLQGKWYSLQSRGFESLKTAVDLPGIPQPSGGKFMYGQISRDTTGTQVGQRFATQIDNKSLSTWYKQYLEAGGWKVGDFKETSLYASKKADTCTIQFLKSKQTGYVTDVYISAYLAKQHQ